MTCLGLVHRPRRSLQPKQVTFDLEAPDGDEECPIGSEPIAQCCLDFLPGVCYDPLQPDRSVAHLQCGHRFNAMNLVYHWARNNTVRCPVCRHGHATARLNMRTLPSHFRGTMSKRVRQQRHADDLEVIEDDRALAVQMSFMVFVEAGTAYMSFVGVH